MACNRALTSTPLEHLWNEPERQLHPGASLVPDLTNALMAERAQIPTATFPNLLKAETADWNGSKWGRESDAEV